MIPAERILELYARIIRTTTTVLPIPVRADAHLRSTRTRTYTTFRGVIILRVTYPRPDPFPAKKRFLRVRRDHLARA
jgi:hypothetical protein